MKGKLVFFLFVFTLPYIISQQCGDGANEGQFGVDQEQGQCGGQQEQGQCGGQQEQGQCGGESEEEGCGGGGDYPSEKDIFLGLVGAGGQAGGCGGGGYADVDSGEGQCGGDQDEGQCGGDPGLTLKDQFLNMVGVGNGGGGCGGEGEDNNDIPDDGASFLASMMASFYRQFSSLSEEKRKEAFSAFIPKIDRDHDKTISDDELHLWVHEQVEEEAQSIELSGLHLLAQDSNGDGKISWEEYKAEQKKLHGEESKFQRRLKKAKSRFGYVDQNKNGYIDDNEFYRLVSPDSYQDMNEMTVEHFFIDYDIDGNNKVSKKEFKDNSENDPKIYDADEQFENYDKNQDDELTEDEVRSFMYEFLSGPHINAEVKSIYNHLDANRTGKLSYDQMAEGHVYFTDQKMILPQKEIDEVDNKL